MKRTMILAALVLGVASTKMEAQETVQQILQRIRSGHDSAKIEYARSLGCSAVQRSDTMYPAKVGQSICQVLAHTGVPDRRAIVSSSGGQTLFWYYFGDNGTHLVVIVNRRVTDVNW